MNYCYESSVCYQIYISVPNMIERKVHIMMADSGTIIVIFIVQTKGNNSNGKSMEGIGSAGNV